MGAVKFAVVGKVDGVPRVVLEHITRTDPEQVPEWEKPPAGADGCYRIKITGEPMMNVDFTHHGEHGDHNVCGMITTAQRIINALPAVVAAEPGIVRAIDLPLVTGRGLVSTAVSILDRFAIEGQVAIVTGAGRGLGAGTAVALAEAGADLVISARTADQLERGGRADPGAGPQGRRRPGRPQRPRRGRRARADGVRRVRPHRHRGQQRRRHLPARVPRHQPAVPRPRRSASTSRPRTRSPAPRCRSC